MDLAWDYPGVMVQVRERSFINIIIIINRRSGITSHTFHGHKTGTRSMQPVRSVPLGGPVLYSYYYHNSIIMVWLLRHYESCIVIILIVLPYDGCLVVYYYFISF